MSPKRQDYCIALTVGLALALASKLIYDLFNGYSTVENYLAHEGIGATVVEVEVAGVIAIVILAFIVGFVLVSAISTAPARLGLACAIPWVAFTLYGLVSGFIRTASTVQMAVMFSSLPATLMPTLTILSVPLGLSLAVKSLRRRTTVAL